MVTIRFSNDTGKPLELMIEPWGAIEIIAAGSSFAIAYPAPAHRADTSHAEVHEGMIRFWCEGATYEVDVDLERILT